MASSTQYVMTSSIVPPNLGSMPGLGRFAILYSGPTLVKGGRRQQLRVPSGAYNGVILRDFSPEGSRAERPIAEPACISTARKMLGKLSMTSFDLGERTIVDHRLPHPQPHL